jgi:hypothetical protein
MRRIVHGSQLLIGGRTSRKVSFGPIVRICSAHRPPRKRAAASRSLSCAPDRLPGEWPRKSTLSFGLELFAVRVQKHRPSDYRNEIYTGQCQRGGLRQMFDILTESVSTEPKHRCSDDGAGGILYEEARPRHAIDAGQQRRQDPEQRDEAAEKDNFATMALEQILSDLNARLGQTDNASISDEETEADFPSNRVADIVADDGARRCRGDDPEDAQFPGLAGIAGCASPGKGKPMRSWQTTLATATEPYFMIRVAVPTRGLSLRRQLR